METKRAKVVMLPTKDESLLIKTDDKLFFNNFYGNSRLLNDNAHYQHLYFITDDEIKEGDWVLWGSSIQKANNKAQHNKGIGIINWKEVKDQLQKIVATTDPNLLDATKSIYLPKPSKAFIEKYCRVGGIDEVKIELEPDYSNVRDDEPMPLASVRFINPKTNSRNEITIHPIKDSWNRDEVELLCREAYFFAWNKRLDHTFRKSTNSNIDKWIEDNL